MNIYLNINKLIIRNPLKNTAADVGSTIIEGIGSVIGTSKVKKQQQEIDSLKMENQNLFQEVKDLKQNIQVMQKEHETAEDKLKQELKKVYYLFPNIKELLWIEGSLQVMQFSESLIKDILKMNPVGFKGKIYSPEYKRYFETEHSIAEIKSNTTDRNKLQLTIDGVSYNNWFRIKHQELKHKVPNRDMQQKKGIRM